MHYSRYLTQQSHISDALLQKILGIYWTSRNSIEFQNWIDSVIDKNLSFHSGYIKSLPNKDKNIFLELRKSVELISYLSLKLIQSIDDNTNIENIHENIKEENLIQFGFSEYEIHKFFENMDKLEIPENDRIATRIGNNIRLNDISLKFALQTNLSKYLTSMKSRGDWFEIDYILNYLKDFLDKTRFIVTTGINNPKEKYDSDIIIYDKTSNLIYFCQVKHRVKTIHPFFRDEFNEYCRNEQLNHGIKQLTILRDKLSTDSVKSRLISRLGKKIIAPLDLEKNSRFILLHSM